MWEDKGWPKWVQTLVTRSKQLERNWTGISFLNFLERLGIGCMKCFLGELVLEYIYIYIRIYVY